MNEASVQARMISVLREEPADIIREIHPNDPMNYNPGGYAQAGLTALRCIRLALSAANAPMPRRIMDLPSGYGRVLRVLKAAYPDAVLTACDIRAEAVEFCVTRFGARGVMGKEDPNEIDLPASSFDLIWCGSLLTHVDDEEWVKFIRLFERCLSPGGVLVFTTSGRLVAEKRVRSRKQPLSFEEAQIPQVLSDYDRAGFGFCETLSQKPYTFRAAYGDCIITPAWVCATLAEVAPKLQLVSFTEGGWGSRNEWSQDVVAYEKPPVP